MDKISQDKKINLLFITQKIDENDDDLGFTVLWIKELIKQGVGIDVICLQEGHHDNSFPVYSLGKEKGYGKVKSIFLFFKYIFKLRGKYNKVFVHMNPEYITLGFLPWLIMRKDIYLWYTHYTNTIHMKISSFFSKKMFAATAQSMPQYKHLSKRVILGHGIDLKYWLSGKRKEKISDGKIRIASVHRISRSKRLDMSIDIMKKLPGNFILDIYGREIDVRYKKELEDKINQNNLGDRIRFMGPVNPSGKLSEIYSAYDLMLNLATETIDKTMLEGMIFGLFPVTTPANLNAIGIDVKPSLDSVESYVDFILSEEWKKMSKGDLFNIVERKHSLSSLISKVIIEMIK